MIVYEVYDPGDPMEDTAWTYYPTLKSAKHAAQDLADSIPPDEKITIRRCVVSPQLAGRRLVCSLLNGRGWQADDRAVHTVRGRLKKESNDASQARHRP